MELAREEDSTVSDKDTGSTQHEANSPGFTRFVKEFYFGAGYELPQQQHHEYL